MKSKIFLKIAIFSILAIALILASIPIITTSSSAIVHEGQMEEHQAENMIYSQDQSAASTSMLERGDVAMGFNQSKISHQFKSTSSGGEIWITALNNSDIETIKQIKNHISVIQKEFSSGNFTKPFYIHVKDVPGTKIMSEKKDLIDYSINEIDNGATLILEAKDKELLDAIHQFMAFQGTEHTGH
ncbi:MAG TPA: hypothetical protein VFV86_11085 [Nitrososphaeraceae archaeon]|nr:hypothetical protein [Nitrososphaeraceae archaeon]